MMKLRLAANPATWLDIAQARQALVAYLLARRHGARLLLRLDDADPGRVRPEHLQSIPHDLAWLGLDWDPDRAAIRPLPRSTRPQPTACAPPGASIRVSRAKRNSMPSATSASAVASRPSTTAPCSSSPPSSARGPKPAASAPTGASASPASTPNGATWRSVASASNSPPSATPSWSAPMAPRCRPSPPPSTTRTSASPTSSARTASLPTTAIQQDILAAFGARPGAIRYAHLPALDLPKPAKSARALTVRTLRGDGIEPEALAAYLAALGAPNAPGPATAAALARTYDLSRIGTAAPRFDPSELLALNRRHLRTLPFEAVQARLPPGASQPFWHAVRGHLDLLTEARAWWDIVANDFVAPPMEAEAAFLRQAVTGLPAEPWNAATWPAWTEALRRATGREGERLHLPLRLALTGEEQGPDLSDLLPLIGWPRAVSRLTRAMR